MKHIYVTNDGNVTEEKDKRSRRKIFAILLTALLFLGITLALVSQNNSFRAALQYIEGSAEENFDAKVLANGTLLSESQVVSLLNGTILAQTNDTVKPFALPTRAHGVVSNAVRLNSQETNNRIISANMTAQNVANMFNELRNAINQIITDNPSSATALQSYFNNFIVNVTLSNASNPADSHLQGAGSVGCLLNLNLGSILFGNLEPGSTTGCTNTLNNQIGEHNVSTALLEEHDTTRIIDSAIYFSIRNTGNDINTGEIAGLATKTNFSLADLPITFSHTSKNLNLNGMSQVQLADGTDTINVSNPGHMDPADSLQLRLSNQRIVARGSENTNGAFSYTANLDFYNSDHQRVGETTSYREDKAITSARHAEAINNLGIAVPDNAAYFKVTKFTNTPLFMRASTNQGNNIAMLGFAYGVSEQVWQLGNTNNSENTNFTKVYHSGLILMG